MLSLLLILAFISVLTASELKKALKDDEYICPGSDSKAHASCKVHIKFEESCKVVQDEMSNRIAGQYDKWHDPHNNGTYTQLSKQNYLLEASRLTGDKKYTDLINYQFIEALSGGCDVYGCSESQVFSIGDAGTNFCNIFSLYCSDDKCQPFTKLTYSESVGKCTQADPALCLP